MKPVYAFVLINLLAFSLMPLVESVPDLEDYRPPELPEGEEVAGSLQIFQSLLVVTAVLLVLKFLRFELYYLMDLSTLVSGYVVGSMFDVGPAFGLLLLGLRKTRDIDLFNISSALTIVCFSFLMAPFMTPNASMLLLALLSLYDVLGVLYFPYIKFLWLEVSRDKRLDTLAFVFDDGMVGAGDFALPLIFSLSFGPVGLLSVPLTAIGFHLNQKLAQRSGAFPGIPFQALFAYAFYVLF